MNNKKIGFTIGKFAPLHKGHEELIEKAISEMDEVYILINNTELSKVSLENRAKWIQKKYPNVHIIMGKNPPKQYGMDETSIKIQTDYLKSIFKGIPVTHFYSGEDYGKYVARDLNVQAINVKKRIPVSSTMIRNDLEKNKVFLSYPIYNEIKNDT